MSYCRWSSNNFDCDIYAYESVGDFYAIHVATNRIVGEVPKEDYSLLRNPEDKESIKKFTKQEKVRRKFLDNCKHEPIGLPFDGRSFECYTLENFYNKMIELRNIGYRFPDYVLEDIKEEMQAIPQMNL